MNHPVVNKFIDLLKNNNLIPIMFPFLYKFNPSNIIQKSIEYIYIMLYNYAGIKHREKE